MSVNVSSSNLGAALLLAPAVFTGHVLEEAPGLVDWFNSHVSRGINQPLFCAPGVWRQ